MSIPYTNTAHFFIHEKRPTNKLKGRVTSHPFACVAIGFEPSESKLPIRIAASMCHSNDRFNRKVAAQKALGLLHTNDEGPHAHAMWFRPSELKNVRSILAAIGFDKAIASRIAFSSNKPEWTRAQKTFKGVLADVQGIRFAALKKAARKAKA